MLKSMTGYGKGQSLIGSRDITVEIKSVNHRFFEFSARTPRAHTYLEEKLKGFVSGKITRGKVDIGVQIFNTDSAETSVEVNSSIANGYISALREANKTLELNDDITLSQLLKFPEVFSVKKICVDENEVWESVRSVAQLALDKFIEMREIEGERLFVDVNSRLDIIEKYVFEIEKRSPQVTGAYRNRLYNRLCEVLEDKNIDEQRILTEAAIFSEKTAVDEETVRLKSHIGQFRELLKSDAGIGRKLDFMVQELNREVNTIGSKAQDIEITKMVVDMKSEIEKIREQIQNIE